MKINAIVVAAGQSSRMGSGVSKVLRPVGGKPLIVRTLERFVRSRTVERVVAVVAPDVLAQCRECVQAALPPGALQITFCLGGARRQDSVKAGLASLDGDCDTVLIHDGARPLIEPAVIDRCVAESSGGRSLCVAVPARNTIKRAVDGLVQETLPRALLWEVQTPQVFSLPTIKEAYELADREGLKVTDDASLVEHLGRPVWIVEGNTTNIKVTYPEDIVIAEALVAGGW